MRNHVLLYLNGQPHALRGADVFSTVSDWLRKKQQLTGTKVVCAEGDCGSCAVLVGRPAGAALQYSVIDSCIAFVFQLDGAHVVTIEGLSDGQEMNPVQTAMVSCQGTQCGFCTPGFVVAMCGLLEQQGELSEARLRRGLTGNLCRCTGYEPILRAGLTVDTTRQRRLVDRYADGQMLKELSQAASEPVRVEAGEQIFFKPTTLADAAAFRAATDGALIVSGATDLGVQVNKGIRQLRAVLSTGAVEAMRRLSVEADHIIAGAGVSLTTLEAAVHEALPEYGALLDHFGSTPIKNAGTLGGNIANGSPIGDTMPALFVLNAEIELVGVAGSRRVNINDFYTGYKRNVMAGDELIAAVHLPLPRPGEVLKLYKISKRKDLDISTFTAAFWMCTDGDRIADIRIAYGGVAPVVMRLPATEAALRGAAMDESTFDAAADIAAGEVRPISDVRGAAGYRQQLAGNVLRKFYFDITGACRSETGTSPDVGGGDGGGGGDGRNGNGNGHAGNGRVAGEHARR
jgi:xanthine dehydrogenase small subunit